MRMAMEDGDDTTLVDGGVRMMQAGGVNEAGWFVGRLLVQVGWLVWLVGRFAGFSWLRLF
jgi:hypothetical protein